MTDQSELKRQAARRAVEFVEDGMKLGLGTGSTARFVLEAIADRRSEGDLQDIVGVPTSRDTREYARELGIPLATLDQETRLDLTLDGADEVDPALNLVKGLGGALLWEKIVASASDRLVIVVDDSKLVGRLATRAPVPVEVVPFGWRTLVEPLRRLGAQPVLRMADGDEPFTTDGGHFILDCAFEGGIEDPTHVDRELGARPGVVETGLFLGMAEAVVVGTPDGAQVRTRKGAAS